jgi:hypothetical protein
MPRFQLPARITLLLATLLVAVIASPVHAAASHGDGSYDTADAKASFTHVYAYRVAEDGSEATELVFAEKPLDTAAIARGIAGRGDGSTTSVLWETVDGAFLRLRLDAEANAELYVYVPPGYNFNYSGKAASLKVNTSARIEGSFSLDDTDMDGKPRRIDLTFATDVTAAGVVPKGDAAAVGSESPTPAQTAHDQGTPLPPDGGEPGKVLQKAMLAQRAGDFDGMVAVSTKAQREKMLADRNNPEIGAMIAMMQAMASSSITIHGGNIDGDTAHVDFTGHYSDGGTSKGLATLRREDGHWAVERVEETR